MIVLKFHSILLISFPIKPGQKTLSYLVIKPCFINLCFISPVHVLPIQSSPYFIICLLGKIYLKTQMFLYFNALLFQSNVPETQLKYLINVG